MTSMRGDIDGPLKRTIDAVFQGLRRSWNKTWVNDGRIVTLHVEKYTTTEEPGLAIHVGYL
jgi:Holliday junction resolvase RusA-like endonuclease